MHKTGVSIQDYVELVSQRLVEHACRIESGGIIQPSVLLPFRYFANNEEFLKRCAVSLLDEVILEIDLSLTTKTLLLKDLRVLCRQFVERPGKGISEQLMIKKEKLLSLQPGFKRAWVHATRRRAHDKVFLFAEQVINVLLGQHVDYYFYELAKLYSFNYDNYRYRIGDDTAQRLKVIARIILVNKDYLNAPTPQTPSHKRPRVDDLPRVRTGGCD